MKFIVAHCSLTVCYYRKGIKHLSNIFPKNIQNGHEATMIKLSSSNADEMRE